MSLEFVRKLPTPTEIREQYPLSARATEIKKQRDAEIAKVFTGDSDKFLVIVGPCSADNEDAVLEYNHRLAKVADKVSDKLIIIPRVYTNKPRTTGEGYKGIVHQPDPEGKPDLLHGLIAMRKMHMRVVEETDLTSADEMLYPSNWSYLSDILSYVAVGARSVENQEHRLTVSGIDIPAGMKNPTSGDLSVMINSVIAAQGSHSFIYRTWEVKTSGNPLAHTILRGATNKHGNSVPNYHYEDIQLLLEKYNEKGRTNQSLIRYYDGASPTALYAVRSAGIDPMTGNEIFIRKDGSYTFKWDSADEVICGDSTPDIEGAFGSSFYWKGFSINAIFSYRYGGQAFLSTLFNKVENISDVQVKYNQDKRALYGRWQKPGDIAKFKRIDDTTVTNMSSRFIADDNTLELSTLSVGYETTTGKWLQSIGASSFNVRIYGNNLFRLSTIKEERGIDYPFSRKISASIGVRF